MGHNVQTCVSNIEYHQLGENLKELQEMGHNIKLERCLQLCVGCKSEPTCIVNGIRILNPKELLYEKQQK